MDRGLMKARQTAEFLGIPLNRVYDLAARGEIPSITIGERSKRFSKEALTRWIESRSEATEHVAKEYGDALGGN